jgi:hypothetical protein
MASWQQSAVLISCVVGVPYFNYFKNPQNLTNFRLAGWETGNRRENKSLQVKSETIVSICDHSPTMPAYTECILVVGSKKSIVLCFSPFQTQLVWIDQKYLQLWWSSCSFDLHQIFLSHKRPASRGSRDRIRAAANGSRDIGEPEFWFQPKYAWSHDPRSVWALVIYNVSWASYFDFDQPYVIFPTT